MSLKKKNGLFPWLALAVGLGGGLAGCDQTHTPISSIMNNPNHFMNRDVQVIGQVTKVYELPLGVTNLAAYRINDNTGQVWIISHTGAPAVGSRVGLRGRVETMSELNLPVLGNVFGDVIDEHVRRVR